jgi:hypothetical protein
LDVGLAAALAGALAVDLGAALAGALVAALDGALAAAGFASALPAAPRFTVERATAPCFVVSFVVGIFVFPPLLTAGPRWVNRENL